MSTTAFQTIRRAEGTDEIWTAAAKLFSEHYGVWGPDSGRQGERIKLGKKRLLAQYLPDDRSIYATVTVSGTLAGQAFASRWENDGRTVCWITQLVVHRDYRRRGLARELLRQLREDGDEVFGIMSSNPAACLAAAGAFARSIGETDLDFIKSHARQILDASPVPYVRDAVLRGMLFHDGDTSGLVSSADTAFFVDHKEPLEVLEQVRRRGYWPLGDLPAGHEFLLLLSPKT